ncbi:MAG: GNAT family N-acetyltransferase [Pseudomonadota bacterium]
MTGAGDLHDTDEWLDYTVTYLEMNAPPEFPHPPAPLTSGFALIRAEAPPVRWFLHLYDSVGADHEWTDWHRRPREALEAFVADPDVTIYTVMLQGWTAGFFMLDWRKPKECELAYLGLAPEGRGRGLGSWLTRTAILTGWERDGVEKMVLETCTLDSPRALTLYQKLGFAPVSRIDKRRRKAGPEPGGEKEPAGSPEISIEETT